MKNVRIVHRVSGNSGLSLSAPYFWVRTHSGWCSARAATTLGVRNMQMHSHCFAQQKTNTKQSRIVWLLKTPYKLSNVRSQ